MSVPAVWRREKAALLRVGNGSCYCTRIGVDCLDRNTIENLHRGFPTELHSDVYGATDGISCGGELIE